DAANVQTRARRSDSGYVLDGRKKWISFGRRADVFVVFAQLEDQPTAFLVERDTPGLRIEAQSGLLGLRGSMLAGLHLEDCEIPSENLLGSEGVGFALVAAASLDRGRYITACGSVGLAQACLDACLAYTRSRHQFGVPLRDHQLVKAMVTDMIANTEAARLLCQRAGYLYDRGHPDTIQANLVAKYFASRTAYRAASDAVQIHGANGCGDGVPVQRYFRDAKIMEIIEGTTQIHQIKIASLS
ncbi:MAG: acyl-CoA dehydrogenase, partial [Acidobacteriota bacterium]